VELRAAHQGLLTGYLRDFDSLIGDRRTRVTFRETVKGIIGAGSLVCQRIASCSALLSVAKDGGQRVIRFATGESTKRSRVRAKDLTAVLRQRGIAQLAQASEDEVWLMFDGSDLRKPYATEMPGLMKVRGLDGKLVPGYRTLNVLGLTPGRRGILYHRLFSSEEEGFVSEPYEVQRALRTVSDALVHIKKRCIVTWITDRGGDDVAVWRTIWEQGERLLCRIYRTKREVEYQGARGEWVPGDIARARRRLRLLATAQAEMVVRRGGQRRAKRQRVTARIYACPIRLSYDINVRRAGPKKIVQKDLWLVEVRLPDTDLEPWLLLTDWPVTNPEEALHIFRMYRQRWAVEDSFRFVKDVFGWEEVQLLDLGGIRTLLALAWIAAGFIYEMGITLEWEEVQLLARLGGWVPRRDNKPGKITLTRGLRRLLNMLVTKAFLERYVTEHHTLPSRIQALLADLDGL